MMTLTQAHALLPGSRLVAADPTALAAAHIHRVHTDTRTLQPGDLFVALRGERFDAHDFLPQARAAGAVAVIAERGLATCGLPGVEVPDALAALQQLASAWRARHTLPLVAVTGSNGKTTVTQMVAGILRAWVGEDDALATAGNYNNHIGVPLTALRLRPHHRAAVLELGMNHPGEIAELAAIAQPTVAIVNNAQREHQEFMASVEAVAHENGSVISALPASGVAVYPADDAHAGIWQALAGTRPTLSFALDAVADVHDDAVWVADDGAAGDATAGLAGYWALRLHTPAGPAECHLHAAGRHNVRNALAAAAATLAAGAPLAAVLAGLEAFRPVSGRSQASRLMLGGRSVTLVDDSYNANPDSVRAAIELLASLPGPHWLVLGDMGEVGDEGPAFHAEVGALARALGIHTLWTAGPLCAHAAQAYGQASADSSTRGAAARHFNDAAAVVAALDEAPACGAVLVKGSRFMRMEQVVRALRDRAAAAAKAGSAQEGGPCC
ncbi:UDP-N-acetylmuramoyl-tripeptide--D-alanyl-D-alanine ligase [Aquabacterium sp. OR-4]|uniref:UDP-N-acetylmuramoyl-tripeptide--D-alanyl-D- alanine ligase n=1 Tax=Aquabacterium sp. OR-4 TaxID=2978127 RepID=UPI0028C8B887|nr:UDP-N-acetylmuramoyl-tripeptide--D-alanyl-D-alanine ligase [Aquabacterium sp. OR-4]MDT7837222.1 UDP-N-acetylmuramoyl-tripeptide--D-alanyl-D-alanine ligase [Aquabacterium sp. OR-4]